MNIVPINSDVSVPVSSGLFMKESDGMHHFMNNRAQWVTVVTKGNALAGSLSPNHRRTSKKGNENFIDFSMSL